MVDVLQCRGRRLGRRRSDRCTASASSCIPFSGQQGHCGVAPFLGLCAGLQGKQLVLAMRTQNGFILSLRSIVSDPIEKIKTTEVSCLTVSLSITSDDQRLRQLHK